MKGAGEAGGGSQGGGGAHSGSMGDDDNAARRPSGGRAAGRMTYGACPGPPPRVSIPEGATPEGAAGLAAIVADPGHALIALDFDGTLAPIVPEPSAARAHPDVLPALQRLATGVGTLAIITGRPAPVAVELGGFAGVPGLIVIGHHGFDRWEGGKLTSPPPPPEVATARTRLPGALAALALLTGQMAVFAAETGLDSQPGRLVIELRPPGVNKGTALADLIAER